MNKKSILFFTQVLIIVIFAFNISHGQIMITSGEEVTAEDLIENILGDGMQYFNAQYQGAEVAKGTFTNGFSTNLGLDGGIVLTSGCASNLEGPNCNTVESCANGLYGGSPILGGCLGSPYLFDECILSFDFIPESDTLRFKYVFGSEEYPEYVLNLYNDGFGFFISGPNPDGGEYNNKNIATVPGTELPVSIGNINNVIPCYEEFYVDNIGGITIEYDGFTTVLTAWVVVVPCEVYHLHLAIADAGDGIVDSGVCLQESSISFPKVDAYISSSPGTLGYLIEGCVEADIIFELPNDSYSPATINFEIVTGPGYATNGIDYSDVDGNPIDPWIYFVEGQDSIALHIVATMDNMLEGDELIALVIENNLGCEVRYDTVSLLIQDYISMTDTITPPTVVCQCQDSIDVWVQVFNGLPPYSYLWEPGGSTNDTMMIDPDTTTIYTVSYTDQCQETGMASTTVTVFPFADLESFYFEAALNPELPFDVYGEILVDTVMILLPPGTNPNGLIASLTTSMEWMMILVDGEYQEPGVTPNDFTNPVIYDIWSPGGHHSFWTVIAEVEVGQSEISKSEIQIFPNPANDHLNILNASGYYISLVSNLGIEVYSGKVEKQKQSININHLEPGVYYLMFENEEREFVRKIVIEK